MRNTRQDATHATLEGRNGSCPATASCVGAPAAISWQSPTGGARKAETITEQHEFPLHGAAAAWVAAAVGVTGHTSDAHVHARGLTSGWANGTAGEHANASQQQDSDQHGTGVETMVQHDCPSPHATRQPSLEWPEDVPGDQRPARSGPGAYADEPGAASGDLGSGSSYGRDQQPRRWAGRGRPPAPAPSGAYETPINRARRRYRERQQAHAAEMRTTAAHLLASFTQLDALNRGLQQQCYVLERVVWVLDRLDQLALAGPAQPPVHGNAALAPYISAQAHALFRTICTDEITQFWTTFVSQCAQLLQRAGAAPSAVAGGAELAQRVDNAARFCAQMALINPDVFIPFLAVNMQTGGLADAGDDHWELAASAANLQDGQREELRVLWDVFESSTRAACTEARTVNAVMSQGLGPRPGPQPEFHPSGALYDVLWYRLAGTVRREFTWHVVLHTYYTELLVSPVQYARVCVQAFPFFPAPVEIVRHSVMRARMHGQDS